MSGSGKNKVTYTIFKGVIINFASNKDIINKTMIATKGDWNIKNRHSAIFIVLLMLLPSIVMAIFNGDSFTPEELIKCVLVWLAAICAFVCYVLFNSKKNKEKVLMNIRYISNKIHILEKLSEKNKEIYI